MSESLFYHISTTGKLSHFVTVEEALAAAKDGGTVWLHYYQTTNEELSNLIEPLSADAIAKFSRAQLRAALDGRRGRN